MYGSDSSKVVKMGKFFSLPACNNGLRTDDHCPLQHAISMVSKPLSHCLSFLANHFMAGRLLTLETAVGVEFNLGL